MTASHPNGASASRKAPKRYRQIPVDAYEAEKARRVKLAACLAECDANLARWGKSLADDHDAFCRVCGAFVAPSAPVDDKKTGGKKVRRRCYRDVGKARVFCNAWWSPCPEQNGEKR